MYQSFGNKYVRGETSDLKDLSSCKRIAGAAASTNHKWQGKMHWNKKDIKHTNINN